MNLSSKIMVAGSAGMVGSSIVRNLKEKGYTNILEATRSVVDLTNQEEVKQYFRDNAPEYVFLAAAKVGGIMANKTQKADFLYDNLMIQNNVIDNAYRSGVKKLLFLGSSCIYPKMCDQPIKEDYLMTGPLEPTNDSYAIAKITGVKLCQSYREQYGFNAISLMPTNLYGPYDNFDIETSHVLPAMIAKYHYMKENGYIIDMGGPWHGQVTLWGDGSPMREFLYVDDLAEACHVAIQKYDKSDPLNVGTGQDVTIKELSETISNIVGFPGETIWDTSKPNGTPRKLLDVSKIKSLGWEPKTTLMEGIRRTYEWYKQNKI